MSAPFSAWVPVFTFCPAVCSHGCHPWTGHFWSAQTCCLQFLLSSQSLQILNAQHSILADQNLKSKIYAAKHLPETVFSVSANKKCHHQFHCKRAMADTQRNNTAILTTQKPQQISLIRMPAAPASPIRHSFYFLILSCEMTDSGFRQAAGLLLSSIAAHSLITVRDVHHLTSLYMHDQ